MSKTTNYQLTLWDYADEGFGPERAREDLAENFTKLDTALKAEETARVAAITAEANARIAATPRVASGAYMGNVPYKDTDTVHTIRLGFRPKAVYIKGQTGCSESGILAVDGHPAAYGSSWISQITDTGFEVRNVTYRNYNSNEGTYHYWAIG